MTTQLLPRISLPASFLYVPAIQPELFDKACQSPAQAIILDLEDSVPNTQKALARNNVREYLSQDRKKPLYLRVNSGKELEEDLLLAQDVHCSGLIFAKAEGTLISTLADGALKHLQKICLIETAAGLSEVTQLAKHVTAFAIGRVDLCADLRIALTRTDFLLTLLLQVVQASAAAGIAAPIAPTYLNIKETNTERIVAYATEFFQAGFRSQTAIHPAFIDSIHQVFLPTKEEYLTAQQFLKTYGADPEQPTGIDQAGNFIDPAVLRQHQEVVERYER